jgi:hypothetical protein
MIGLVDQFERDVEDGGHVVNVQVDFGGGNKATTELFQSAGVDAPPLPDDAAICVDGDGSDACVGFADTKNEGKALGGELRFYARDENGVPVSEVWLKRDGSAELTGIKCGWKIVGGSDGTITLNGATIDTSGNLVVPGDASVKGAAKINGEVTAMASGAAVKLSTHQHPTGVGPSGPPTPGT